MNDKMKPAQMDDSTQQCLDMFSDGPEFDGDAAFLSLGEYRDHDLLTKFGMAQAFKCSFRTLQRMVERFEIPPATPFGGRNVWIVGRLKAWVANMAEAKEAEALKLAKRIYRT